MLHNPTARLRFVRLGLMGIALQLAVYRDLHAQQPAGESTFSQILTSQSLETFAAIVAYAEKHPAAPDRTAALQWIFQTAPSGGWEADAISLAEQTLQSKEADPELVAAARTVLSLGRAAQGDATTSLAALDEFFRALRLRNPNAATDLTQSVALRFQLRDDRTAAEAVYERLSAAFFLNAEVREFCELRKQRLSLLGQHAPAIPVSDLQDRPIAWEDFQGRVVLLDFWATNCRPCIEELPRVKQLARELQPRGLDVLGISLDEEPGLVQSFRESQRIPWRLALDGGKVTANFHVRLIPCLMLVDRTGRIAAVDVRPSDLHWATLKLLTPTERGASAP
jgi:peroxiredoxin